MRNTLVTFVLFVLFLAACHNESTSVDFTSPRSLDDLQKRVLRYLEDGKSAELAKSLEDSNIPSQIALADISGDGRPEVIMVAGQLTDDSNLLETAVWVFENTQGIFLTHTIWRGFEHSDFQITAVEDLNDDAKVEVVIERIWSYGGTCRVIVSVIAWEDREAVDYFGQLPPGPGYLCPAEITLEDRDGDNLTEIVFTGLTKDRRVSDTMLNVTSVYELRNGRYQQSSVEYYP